LTFSSDGSGDGREVVHFEVSNGGYMFSADHVVFTYAVGRSSTAVLPKASSDLSAGGALDLIELTIVEARRTHTHGKHWV
jgi:hypothetical protein